MSHTIVLLTTALWHGLAVWHFVGFPARTLGRSTRERPISVIATELFRFLGGLNLALVVLALCALALEPAARWPVFVALAVANLSQALQDVRVQRMGLARGRFFQQILVGDFVFTGANLAASLLPG